MERLKEWGCIEGRGAVIGALGEDEGGIEEGRAVMLGMCWILFVRGCPYWRYGGAEELRDGVTML